MTSLKTLATSAARRPLVRYILVGGTAYVIELSCLLLIFRATGSRTLAAAIAFLVGFFVAFFLQKLVAFQEYSREVRAIARQGLLFVLLSIWNYVFTVLFVTLFPDKHLVVSRTVALLMMASWNYIIYKKVIFKKMA